jgi:hypothetical protein
MSFWQARIAAWNAGALTGTPLTIVCWLVEPGDRVAWIWMPPPPPDLGSGKFGTPCERTQSASLIPVSARGYPVGTGPVTAP